MRRYLLALIAFLMISLSLGPAMARPAELTISIWIPPTHPLITDFLAPWAQEVTDRTEGRVQMRMLTKPVTNPQGHFDAVRNGLADLTFISHAYYPGRFELTRFAVFPFSGDSALARSVAAWRIYSRHMLEADEHRGVKLLGIYTHGPGAVYTRNRTISQISDFEGLKVRVGGGMAAEVAQALSAAVIAKPAPESYELLSTGVVDGVFFPPESIPGFKLETLVNHVTKVPGGLYSDSHAIIMNQAAFDRLDERDQAIIMELSGEYLAGMAGRTWDKWDAVADEMLADTVATTQADQALIAAIDERTQPIRDLWLEAMARHGLDGEAVLQEFRDEIKAIESTTSD